MHRLAVYMVGVGIGLMLLGLIHRGRTAAMARRAAQTTESAEPAGHSNPTVPGDRASDDSDAAESPNTP